MRLGVSAFAWTARLDRSSVKLAEGLKKQGVAALEVPMFQPSDLPVREIRSALAGEGLACTVCAILPKGVNPISPEASVRRAAADHLGRCLDTAAELGASLIGGPLYAPIGYIPPHRPNQDEWEWAVDAFQRLDPLLDERQLSLSIEPVNRSETSFLRTAEEAARLCDAIGSARVGVTIDTFHANIEELNVPEAMRQLGNQLKHVHISENDRGPVGRGHIPFHQIISVLSDMNYGGYLMIEGFGFSADQIDAPGWLWAAADISPELLVEESVGYLHTLLNTCSRPSL